MNDMPVHEKPWIKSYPPGVTWDAVLETGPVQAILEGAAKTWPDRPALDFGGRVLSYSELDRLADRMAAGLQAWGVGPGVHVGIYLPNTPHYFIAFFGILKAGGTVVNYSPLDASAVLEHKVEDSETDLLFTLDMKSLYPQMHAMLGHTRLRGLIVGGYGDFAADPAAIAAGQQAAGDLVAVAYGDRIRRFPIFWPMQHRSGTISAIRPKPLPCCNIPAAPPGCRKAPSSPMPI
jgi:long-chain acyl-CoA synthetase